MSIQKHENGKYSVRNGAPVYETKEQAEAVLADIEKQENNREQARSDEIRYWIDMLT